MVTLSNSSKVKIQCAQQHLWFVPPEAVAPGIKCLLRLLEISSIFLVVFNRIKELRITLIGKGKLIFKSTKRLLTGVAGKHQTLF